MMNTSKTYVSQIMISSRRHSMKPGIRHRSPDRILDRLIRIFVPPDTRRRYHIL